MGWGGPAEEEDERWSSAAPNPGQLASDGGRRHARPWERQRGDTKRSTLREGD
jgi:hypothetical protein